MLYCGMQVKRAWCRRASINREVGRFLPSVSAITMRIAVVTDSHLAPSALTCNANWRAVQEYLARSAPDLTVHLGDISLDAASDNSQLEAARAICEPWPTPFRFLPGNHDIGDNPPGPGNAAQQPLDERLLQRFRAAFGPDYWSTAVDGWFVIGLNAQLFGRDSWLETDQYRWLGESVREAGKRPVALMLHKPLFQNSREDAAPHIRYVPLGPRRRLLNLLAGANLRVVLSGHVHQYLDRFIEGVRHVWIPSTAFFLPDSIQERVGEKVTGLGLIELSGERYRFDLVCPDGLVRNNLVEQPFYSAIR
jgi:3',5'-cyclic AMP phosphodiesterase CpdA